MINANLVDFRGRFERLLRAAGKTRLKPEIMARLQRVRETAILTAGKPLEAIEWNEWAEALPQTVTRRVF